MVVEVDKLANNGIVMLLDMEVDKLAQEVLAGGGGGEMSGGAPAAPGLGAWAGAGGPPWFILSRYDITASFWTDLMSTDCFPPSLADWPRLVKEVLEPAGPGSDIFCSPL